MQKNNTQILKYSNTQILKYSNTQILKYSNTQFPHIFVISLEKSKRRQIIKNRLDSLNIPFEFIDAINGKDLTQEDLSEVDYDFYPKRFRGNRLKLGEIGCALSHIKAYQHIIDRKLDGAIILEDDAIVSEHFKKIIIDALNKCPQRKEIILLYHGKAKSHLFKRSLVEGYRLARYRYPSKNSCRAIMTTTGYYLTLSGAKLLMQHAYPIRMPSDFLTGAIQMTKIKAYGIEPSCIFTGSDSEIDLIESRK